MNSEHPRQLLPAPAEQLYPSVRQTVSRPDDGPCPARPEERGLSDAGSLRHTLCQQWEIGRLRSEAMVDIVPLLRFAPKGFHELAPSKDPFVRTEAFTPPAERLHGLPPSCAAYQSPALQFRSLPL